MNPTPTPPEGSDVEAGGGAGRKIGTCRLGRVLGAGERGIVYQAFDERLGRGVALKRLRREVLARPGAREHWLREVRDGARFHHPNVVQVHGLLEVDGVDWVVLELVEGENLRQLLRPGPLAAGRRLALAATIAETLAAAHAAGFVHRGLDPDHVLITPDGRVKILGFGPAAPLAESPPAARSHSADLLALRSVLRGMSGPGDEEIDRIFEDGPDEEPSARSIAAALRRLADATASSPGRREHRQVTVLCCDLASRAGSSGASGLEAVAPLIEGFLRLAQEVVERWEGRVTHVLGHRLVTCFGFPRAHEDDAWRAVHAAWELAAGVAAMAAPDEANVASRAAVHTGPAVAPTVGGGAAMGPAAAEPPALGRTLDLAEDLLRHAEPGDLLVSGDTRRLVRGRGGGTVAVEPLAGAAGESAPPEAFRVLEAETGSGSWRVAADVAIVGRRRELELLLDHFRRARAGHGQVLLLSGEAGVGKSRLVRALHRRRAPSSPTWLVARGASHARGAALQPILELLREVAGFTAGDSPERRLDRLEHVLTEPALGLGPELAVPLVASLFSLPFEERWASPEIGPGKLREATLEVIVELLASWTRQRPGVLVVEDLHWVDPTSLELLGRLAARCGAVPLFLLLVARPELEAPWLDDAAVTRLDLDRLTLDEVEELIGRVVGDRELPATVRRRIAAKTDGVPLFVEELTRDLLESGPGDGRDVPATLRDSLTARLDRLGGAKQVAQLAATIGREIRHDLLVAVAPFEASPLERHLERLVAAGLIHRRGFASRRRYVFKHALVQDAAYDSLLRAERCRWHAVIAGTLEEGLPGVALPGESDLPLLAHHWSRSVDPRRPDPDHTDKAVDYLTRTGEHYLRLSAYPEASGSVDEAFTLVAMLPQGPGRGARELALEIQRCAVLRATESWCAPQVESSYEHARHLSRDLGDRARHSQALFGLWGYHLWLGSYERSRHWAEECLALAGESGDEDLLMEASCALGNSRYWLGELGEALRDAERVTATFEAARHADHYVVYGQDPRMIAGQLATWSLWLLGCPREAGRRDDEVRRLAQDLDHAFSKAIAHLTSAELARFRGDVAAVRREAERLIELSSDRGFPEYESGGRILASWAVAGSGNPSEAEQQVVRIARERKQGVGVAFAHLACVAAEACAWARQPEKGLDLLAAAEQAVDDGEHVSETELFCLRGELLLELARRPTREARRTGYREQAETALRRSFDAADRRRQRPYLARAGRCLGRLLEHDGRVDEATVLRAEIQRRHERCTAQVRSLLAELAGLGTAHHRT